MKKAATIFLLATFLSGAGCKNDLKILAPYKDIPVIYGLLDQNDTTHYIRINKAYEGTGDAFIMAQQYDSINYPVGLLTVQLQDYNNSNLIKTITLDTTTSVQVNPGIFSYPKQVLYYTRDSLSANDQYNLIVTNNKTGKKYTGSTGLLPDVLVSPNYIMSSGQIDFSTGKSYLNTISWYTNTEALIYQFIFRFHYTEIDTTPLKNDTSQKYIDWVFPAQTAASLQGGYVMNIEYVGTDFLQFIRGYIPPVGKGSNIKRVAGKMQVLFTSGTQDLNTYIQLSQPSLTVNQEKPFYSNVKNAVGIFTARHTQTAFKTLSVQTLDSLQYDWYLVPLNFKPN